MTRPSRQLTGRFDCKGIYENAYADISERSIDLRVSDNNIFSRSVDTDSYDPFGAE
jgi:hypothetical protein